MRCLSAGAMFLCLAVSSASQQHRGIHPPQPGTPKIEVKGVIEKIRIAMGHGMPSLTVRAGDRVETVWLGSMRYLMEQDFRPKAGDDVAVSGYRADDGLVAIAVTTRGKILRLRDEAGFPLWMRRRGGPPAALPH